MPNRIIKESICKSAKIDSLSWQEESLFYRLIVNCDDFGRFDGRPKIIKSYCFPLKNITDKDIEKGIMSLVRAGLIGVYEIEGKPYIQILAWEKHQQIRNKKSKYPDSGGDFKNLISIDIKCNQMKSIDCNCSRNPIQSEYEYK